MVKHGQSINLGCFRIEFVKTNHSIADASALAIFTPAGIILHTGDFKIDYTPVFGEPADLRSWAKKAFWRYYVRVPMRSALVLPHQSVP